MASCIQGILGIRNNRLKSGENEKITKTLFWGESKIEYSGSNSLPWCETRHMLLSHMTFRMSHENIRMSHDGWDPLVSTSSVSVNYEFRNNMACNEIRWDQHRVNEIMKNISTQDDMTENDLNFLCPGVKNSLYVSYRMGFSVSHLHLEPWRTYVQISTTGKCHSSLATATRLHQVGQLGSRKEFDKVKIFTIQFGVIFENL